MRVSQPFSKTLVEFIIICNCRFQEQTKLHKSKPGDLWMAIEEAFLAEHGFSRLQDDLAVVGQPAKDHELPPLGFQEATGSNHDQDCQSQFKVI